MSETDINHPRRLLVMWRAEAERMTELAGPLDKTSAAWASFRARAAALRQCADELENRLIWSGIP